VALAGADLVGALLCALLTLHIYSEPPWYGSQQVLAGIGGFMLLWSLAAHSQRVYVRTVLLGSLRAQLLRCVASVALTFSLILLLAFGFKITAGFSRLWLLAWSISTFAWMAALRLAWRHYLRRLFDGDRCLERALLLTGTFKTGLALGEDIEQETLGEVRIVASATLPGTPDGPFLARIEDAVRKGLVDRVFIAGFDDMALQTNLLLTRLARLAVEVTLIPSLESIQAPVLRADKLGMRAMLDVNLMPLTALQVMTKRIEDLVLGSVLLVLASPALAMAALAIRLDSPGPVFFRQRRAGFHDQPFKMWKFRTMYHDLRDEGAVRQTSRADPRVTRVGRFLRRTSLDELPQLLNVIRGEMSIVGPRPHALSMMAMDQPMHEVIAEYSARHRMKPGITGWAQVRGCRGEINSHNKLRRRVAFDCEYINNWSLGFDMWIILRTAVTLLFDKNAY
jgi:Undecaprenyl-phosphate glucose phosphotransferase